MVKHPKFMVSPYKKVMYAGKLRSSIKFKTKAGAVKFIKGRKLKHAILYKLYRR